jgi:hypothetical protein
MLWILIHVCLQFTGDYWLRHIRPDYTEDFANAIDAAIRTLFQACIGMNINLWSDIAMERMWLPIRYRGLGLFENQLIDVMHSTLLLLLKVYLILWQQYYPWTPSLL